MGLEAIAIGAIVGSTAVGLVSANKQAKAAKQANALNQQAFEAEQKSRRLEEKRRAISAARERRQLVREARVARADITATAGATGTGMTSGAISGAANVTAQAAQGQSFLNINESISQSQGMFLQQAANLQSQAAQVQANAQVSAARMGALQSIFGAAGSIAQIKMAPQKTTTG